MDLLYQAYSNDRFEVMLGGGLHALDLGADIRGQVLFNELEGNFREAGDTFLAPVPNPRLMSLWTVSDNIALRLNAGWLSANVDEYDGSFTYVHLRGSYQFGERFGVAVGYQFTDIDIEQQRTLSTRSYEVELDGPTITFSYAF